MALGNGTLIQVMSLQAATAYAIARASNNEQVGCKWYGHLDDGTDTLPKYGTNPEPVIGFSSQTKQWLIIEE